MESRKIRVSCILLFVMVFLLSGAYYLRSPTLAFFLPIVTGLGIVQVSKLKRWAPDFETAVLISPALGFSILIISMYLGSLLKLGVKASIGTFNLATLILGLYLCTVQEQKNTPSQMSSKHFIKMLQVGIPALLLVGIHMIAYTYPTDNVDNFFHATKIWYIIKYDTMYPPSVPVFNVLSYPGGYHSVITYMTSVSNSSIPEAMKVFRVWAWLLFAFGVFLLAKTWFNRRIGLFSLLAIIGTNMCYYYLLVYIEPNFFGFYFFTVMLSLAHISVAKGKIDTTTLLTAAVIGMGTLTVHPYSFQNFWFIFGVYLVIIVLIMRNDSSLDFKKFVITTGKFILIFGLIPFAGYMLLNPYFMFPSLANVHIEYPWASHQGVVIKNLAMFRGRGEHDTPEFFKLLLSWTFKRNSNYVSAVLIVVSAIYSCFNRWKKEYFSLIAFMGFVLALMINRLTLNIPIPFYGTAAMERMYLWLLPLFPVVFGIGMYAFYDVLGRKSLIKKIFYILVLAGFFIAPSVGNAIDMLSAEANFYVTEDVLEDFAWINTHINSAYVLNSCHADSTPWLPFFADDGRYIVMFDSYFSRCRFNNITMNKTLTNILLTNMTLPRTIAYIDTNAPSINPLWFLERYELIRINGNNWMFNMSSRNTSRNMNLVLRELRLCSSNISGDTHNYGKYYIWGFTKKYFYVKYFELNGKEYAWLIGDRGIIAFNPCKEYSQVKMEVLATRDTNLSIAVNGKLVLKQKLSGGFHVITINANVYPDKLNTITLSKTEGIILIKNIELGGS